jgi:hypothetical protein
MVTSLFANPLLGLALFVLFVVFNAVMLSREHHRPLNALTGLFATWAALAFALVPAAGWWSFFVNLGRVIHFVNDPLIDGVVAMGSCFALLVAWLCMITIERPTEHPHALAVHLARLNRASLTVIGIGVTAAVLIVYAVGEPAQPMMMVTGW